MILIQRSLHVPVGVSSPALEQLPQLGKESIKRAEITLREASSRMRWGDILLHHVAG